MAKVTRERLARGTKLTPDHVQTPLLSVATELNNATITQEQLSANDGTFRVNLHIPYLASDFPFSEDDLAAHLMQEFAAYSIPFTLPPTQDMWSASTAGYSLSENQPRFVLEEVSFSFDQRGEPCAIKDQLKDNLDLEAIDVSGDMDFDMVEPAYELAISMVEKPQGYFGESDFAFQKTIFNAPLSSQLFQSDTRRFNPLIVTGINASISPFRTYAFTIRAPGLGKTGSKPANRKSQALVSVQISLKIKSTLIPRDVYSGTNVLQNWPTKDTYLTKRSRTALGMQISVTPPNAGESILADTGSTAKAISPVMGVIDDEYRHKLGGGVDQNSEAFSLQQLFDDASYEVIAVPLMNNRRFGGVISRYVNEEPYSPGAAGPVWDRRVVPVYYPMAIHHVVLAWNWNRFYALDPAGGGGAMAATNVPAQNTFTVDIGVGMGEGLRSDGHGYQQISSLQLVNPANPHQPAATWSAKMLDRCSANAQEHVTSTVNFQSNGAVRPAAATTGNFNWEWELHSMPLVGSGGSGYYAQGKPIFIGKSWSATQAKTNIGGGASAVAGREEFLEVRMKISDSAGFPVNDEVVSGYQGHWVYIIGKKFLTR